MLRRRFPATSIAQGLGKRTTGGTTWTRRAMRRCGLGRSRAAAAAKIDLSDIRAPRRTGGAGRDCAGDHAVNLLAALPTPTPRRACHRGAGQSSAPREVRGSGAGMSAA